MNLNGVITALVTPFKGESIDEEGLATNIQFQMANGVKGILVLGSTGEAPTLSLEEQEKVIKIAVEVAQKKVSVLVGTGYYCTKQTIEKTKKAQALGADGALIVTPYYNKPTQEGLIRHYQAISEAVNMPMMVYNIPGRSGINIETETLIKIAQLPNFVGIKESTGNIQQASEFIGALRNARPDFAVFSGDDATTLPMMSLGAVGVISVISNLMPSAVVKLVDALERLDISTAQMLHYQLAPLFKAVFIETNPVPIKTAMNLFGMPAGECRLPLSPLSEKNHAFLKESLAFY